jgi:hypothetical protein
MSTNTATDADARDPNFPQPALRVRRVVRGLDREAQARPPCLGDRRGCEGLRRAAGCRCEHLRCRGGGLAGAADEPERVAQARLRSLYQKSHDR